MDGKSSSEGLGRDKRVCQQTLGPTAVKARKIPVRNDGAVGRTMVGQRVGGVTVMVGTEWRGSGQWDSEDISLKPKTAGDGIGAL